MFFYIGDKCPIKSMKQVEPRLFLDEGWSYLHGVWYKGYSTECVLSDSLVKILEGYQPAGKWCAIYNGKIHHPVLRGFPVYSIDNQYTNMKLEGVDLTPYNELEFPVLQEQLTLEQASDMIGDILVENTKNLYKYNSPCNMTALFSAGLDSLTAWVILDQVTKDYTLSVYLPNKEDTASLQTFNGTRRDYSSDLIDKASQDYWGYYHACFYEKNNWTVTGYYAEVYTYRDGEAINAIANYHGKRIDELATEQEYLHWFLRRPKIVEKYKDSKLKFADDIALKRFLWSTIWYDHQMWHLDNNMMFSPFADVRITEIVNRMSVSDIVRNSVTGQIQRNIINRFRPDLLCLLSDYKNAIDIWKNFRANFNESMLHPNTKLIYR